MRARQTKTAAVLIGTMVAALAYYVMATVPPGTTLTLNTEVTSTKWSNISFSQDTSNNAEIMYVLRVDHSPIKGGFSLALGILASVLVLWRGRADSAVYQSPQSTKPNTPW